jgi:hypothetical protein
MWEEHPEYQRAQAKTLGVLLVILSVTLFVQRFAEGGWQRATGILVFFLCFVTAFALLPFVAWLLISGARGLHTAYRRLRANRNA